MQRISTIVWAVALCCLFACQGQPGNSGRQPSGDTAAQLQPAKPAGAVQVSFTQEDDTSQVKIRFTLNGREKERSFDLPLAKDAEDADLYRTVWDKPNSCYIGVLKEDRGTRYYHASEENGELKILQVGTPPRAVWQYAEGELGLGKIHTGTGLTDNYKRNFQSGRIIADFIVRLSPGKDSVQLYTEFGGASRTQSFPVPAGQQPVIQLTGNEDHCLFGFRQGDSFDAVIDIRVDKGRLQLTNLKRITN